MTLDLILLKNFRLYENAELALGPGFNLIRGANGTGKTSLLEGVSALFSGYSFRKTHDRHLTRKDCSGYYLAGRIRRKNEVCRMEVFYQREKGREILLDHKKADSFKDLMIRFPYISFEPEDRELITGEPELRRRFFDRMISYLEPLYYEELIRYQRLLKQRNRLLREKSLENIDFWEQELAVSAHQIAGRREAYVALFNGALREASLPEGTEGIFFEYKKSAGDEPLDLTLKKNRPQDFKMGFTSRGPHRDDFLIRFSLGVLKHFASQGQMKTLSFYLKLICARLFDSKLSEKPVLLVDDIFAELDLQNRMKILSGLEELQAQTLMTSVEGEGLEALLKTPYFYFETRRGEIISEGESKP